MTDPTRSTRLVHLEVEIPSDLADAAEDLQANDPEMLVRLLAFGLMRVQTYRYLREMHAERTLGDAVRRHVEEGQRA